MLSARERDKWDFTPARRRKLSRGRARASANGTRQFARDTVVAAHGGVARALIANLDILPDEEAAHADIVHGVVYVFAAGTMARYA